MFMENSGYNIYFVRTIWLQTVSSRINETGILKQCMLNVLEKHLDFLREN